MYAMIEVEKLANVADKKPSRKEKRKLLKYRKRKSERQAKAQTRVHEETSSLFDENNDTNEQNLVPQKVELDEEKRRYEIDEETWLERERKLEEWSKVQDEISASKSKECKNESECVETQVDSGPEDDGVPEIIWEGNEIIVRKKKKKKPDETKAPEDPNRPTSNPLAPTTVTFTDIITGGRLSTPGAASSAVATEVSANFGTEQDRVHCPFYLKTGSCQFGVSCNRLHAYPSTSNTILIRNFYTPPGVGKPWLPDPYDENLEHDEQSCRQDYVEFYEDVHPEFQKFGEIKNFKVCSNAAPHLCGNVYVEYKDMASAIAAFTANNGRFFASKQLTCEFVPILSWRKAICGQFLRSARRVGFTVATCSRGQSCNFLHPFENPGRDYEWADWDESPPRYWRRNMEVLFGSSEDQSNSVDIEERKVQTRGSGARPYTENVPSRLHGGYSLEDRGSHERRGNGRSKREEKCADGKLHHRGRVMVESRERTSKKRLKTNSSRLMSHSSESSDSAEQSSRKSLRKYANQEVANSTDVEDVDSRDEFTSNAQKLRHKEKVRKLKEWDAGRRHDDNSVAEASRDKKTHERRGRASKHRHPSGSASRVEDLEDDWRATSCALPSENAGKRIASDTSSRDIRTVDVIDPTDRWCC